MQEPFQSASHPKLCKPETSGARSLQQQQQQKKPQQKTKNKLEVILVKCIVICRRAWGADGGNMLSDERWHFASK